MTRYPPTPTQCYLGYAYACSKRPPFSAKVRCVKSIRVDLFLLLYEPFSAPPPPPFSAKVRCVKSIRVDLFLLFTKGHFGNTHGVRPFSEWGGGGGGSLYGLWHTSRWQGPHTHCYIVVCKLCRYSEVCYKQYRCRKEST